MQRKKGGDKRDMAVLTVFFQMLALLIMIGAGYLIAKKGMMDAHTSGQISGMVVNVFNPLLFFSSAANAVGLIRLDTMLRICLIAVVMFAVFIVAGMILTPLFDKNADQRKMFQMMFVFSNLGFIGIPVVSSILGSEYVVYVTEFLVVYNIFFYTYGIAVMDGSFSLSSLNSLVNPGTVCSVIAMVVIIYSIQIPEFIKTATTYLGNAASPLALILVGFSLAQADMKKIFGEIRLYLFSLIKLLLLPLLMLPFLRMATDDAAVISVCILMFGMPVGNMILMLGNERGIDGTTCGAAIILSTVLCVFTVPVLLLAVG